MKHFYLRLLLGALVVAIVGGGYFYFFIVEAPHGTPLRILGIGVGLVLYGLYVVLKKKKKKAQ